MIYFIKNLLKGDIVFIRKAEEKDLVRLYEMLAQVQQLHADGRPDIFKAGTNKYNMDEIRLFLANPLTPVFVADNDGVAVGYAFCDIKEQKESHNLRPIKTYYLDDLCVDKNYRGKGIGKALYEHVRLKAKEEGCYHLTLNVWQLNPSALRFYEKLGMKPLKTVMEEIL